MAVKLVKLGWVCEFSARRVLGACFVGLKGVGAFRSDFFAPRFSHLLVTIALYGRLCSLGSFVKIRNALQEYKKDVGLQITAAF